MSFTVFPASSTKNRFQFLLTAILLSLLVACSNPRRDHFAAVSDPAVLKRGAMLVHGLAACGVCHGSEPRPNSPLIGGRPQTDLYGEVLAPNITPAKSGIAGWTGEEIMVALRGAEGKGERKLSTKVHRGFEWMSDDDLVAVVSYIRSIPPIEHEVARRDVGFIDRNTTGLFDSARDVRGYVPPVDSNNEVTYGQYLVDNVARCSVCHNTEATFATSEGYLTGGATIRVGDKEKIAPGISGSALYGLGDWSEVEIVKYFQTGETPQGKFSDPDFCPVEFYRLAPASDLHAMAVYLKSVR